MKVTKYPQSCLLIEKDDKRIVIDPGGFFAAKYKIDEFGTVEAVLYTHQHQDHYDESIAEQFKSQDIPLYGNDDVCKLIGEGAISIQSGQSFEVAGFSIMPHDLPHFEKEGWEVPQNTGYVIDGNFFHPGDGIKTSGVTVDNLAAPIGGAFTFDAPINLAQSLQAKRIIPIHYSAQQLFPVDVNEFAELAKAEFEIIILEDGQSTEL